MATHSSILAWKIPCTEESGGLQAMGSQRVGHRCTIEHFQTEDQAWEIKKDLCSPIFLPSISHLTKFWTLPPSTSTFDYMMCEHTYRLSSWPWRSTVSLEDKIDTDRTSEGQAEKWPYYILLSTWPVTQPLKQGKGAPQDVRVLELCCSWGFWVIKKWWVICLMSLPYVEIKLQIWNYYNLLFPTKK